MALNKQQLDLDALVPEPSTIKLGGKEYELLPPTMNDLVFVGKLVNMFSDEETNADTASTAIEALTNFLPKLIKDFDPATPITLEQATAIIEFIFTVAAPPEARAAKEVGETPVADDQKKTTA